MSANNPATGNSGEDEREIEITRVFDVDRDLVFEAWTNPIHLARWWGPQGFSNPICEVDLRVDGKWRVVMRAPDGSEIPFTAVYREVVPPERLVFSSVAKDPAGNSVLEGTTTVLFEDFNGQTKLTIRARAKALVPEAVIRLGGMYEGWSSSLDRLMAEITSIHQNGGRG
jgi:uncharacterized protein YndB with AHSA1/START domain